jgi:catechol 2,3-dioxygenase-like lactoylglutathione lyase family enzyme
MASITGVGGIFFKSPDPKKLSEWYRDVLGFALEEWGGSLLRYDAPGHPPFVVWSPFAADSGYYKPSQREFMLNFAVDDLDGFLAAIAAKGVTVLDRKDEPYGRFAWIMDPDGTKIELWQPIKPPEH